MNEEPRPARRRGTSLAARARLIEKLAAPQMLGELSLLAVQSVLALRLVALCSKAAREPVAELTRRFRSVTAAKAFLALADGIGRYWPEPVAVHPPCCRGLSPDETTLALMVDAARAGDREGFRRALDGIVRTERHEALYGAALDLAAALDSNEWRSGRPAL